MNPRATGFNVPDHLPAIAPPKPLAIELPEDPRKFCGCPCLCADCSAETGYSTDDAQCDVAQNLIDMDEVSAVVADLYDAKALFHWLANNVDIPTLYLPAFRAIDRRVSGIWNSVDDLEAQHA